MSPNNVSIVTSSHKYTQNFGLIVTDCDSVTAALVTHALQYNVHAKHTIENDYPIPADVN